MTYTIVHTLKFFVLILFFFLSFVLLTATKTHAYFSTSQEATALDDHAGLFQVDYSFGHKSHTMHMPLYTQMSEEKDTTKLSYVILDENDNEVSGKTAGIVLSGAPLGRQGYEIEKDSAKKFSLFVVFKPTEDTTGHSYRLQVTHLPFSFDGAQQLQLNPSELQYYTTKSIKI